MSKSIQDWSLFFRKISLCSEYINNLFKGIQFCQRHTMDDYDDILEWRSKQDYLPNDLNFTRESSSVDDDIT